MKEAIETVLKELASAQKKSRKLENKIKELEKNSLTSIENLPNEIWRDVVGYEGLYQVSNFGRVKSFAYKRTILLRQTIVSDGYVHVTLYKNGNKRSRPVHILVAQAFIPNPENKSEVNHEDLDKANNCVENLSWVIPKENVAHAIKAGVIKLNEIGYYSQKLTIEDAQYIREIYKKGDPEFGARALSKKFGVSHSSILKIVH